MSTRTDATVIGRAVATTLPAASVAAVGSVRRHWWVGVSAAIAWAAVGLLTIYWPDRQVGFRTWSYTDALGVAELIVALALLLGWASGRVPNARGRALGSLRNAGPWLLLLAVLTGLWEVSTAKTGVLPPPFFGPPQALIEVYATDSPRLFNSLWHSLWLLANGYFFGAGIGFMTGVAIGWSRPLGYWIHPVLRFLGPVPSTALLPLSFFIFPSSWSAAVFLIALSAWFPVTVLTWSGVASVNRAYYDVARTLGARPSFLVFRVAIPGALPHVFVGLFMGLGHAFSVLVVAEMMGVKSGLGWYLSWAQGWASYANMYAALIVMAVVFSGIITLLFVVRDRLLDWQKGVVKW